MTKVDWRTGVFNSRSAIAPGFPARDTALQYATEDAGSSARDPAGTGI